MTGYKTIVPLLDTLTKDELVRIQERIKMLIGNGSVNTPISTDEDMVLNIISKVLSSAGMEFTPAWMLKKVYVFKSFQSKLPGISKFIDQTDCTRSERLSLLTMSIKLLMQDITDRGLPLSSRQLMAHIHRIPEVLNKAFPHYASSGLLCMIIRQTQR